MDKQVHENELLIPALRIISNNPGISTSELKDELEKVVDLYPKDKAILNNRTDNYFSQTVRNLCGSHLSTNEFGKCVNVEKNGNVNCFKINKKGIMTLKNEMEEEIEELVEDQSYQMEIEESPVYDAETLKQASNREPQLSKTSTSKRYKTDARIAKTVLAEKNYKCEYSNLIGKDHITFTTKKGVQYQEGHHLIPIKAQKDFKMNIDRPENIVCLCPICHRAVHNAKKEEKIEILKKIYDNKISDLKKVGINISFEDLFNKYYV